MALRARYTRAIVIAIQRDYASLGDYWIPIIKVSIETRLFPPELYTISPQLQFSRSTFRICIRILKS